MVRTYMTIKQRIRARMHGLFLPSFSQHDLNDAQSCGTAFCTSMGMVGGCSIMFMIIFGSVLYS